MANKIQIIPDYKKLYTDYINQKTPAKMSSVERILNKEKLSNYDVLMMNNILFQHQEASVQRQSQKHRAYSKETIVELLRYQLKNQLNNSEMAKKFNLSRNSIAKWKLHFSNEIR